MLRDTIVNTQTLAQKADGILAFYDISRSKWQSITRQTVTFGIKQKNLSAERWLSCIGDIRTNQSGYKIPRDGTITSLTLQSEDLATASFKIRRNGVLIDLHSLDLVNQAGKVLFSKEGLLANFFSSARQLFCLVRISI